MSLLKTLVVGAGNMGALYDTPQSAWVLTHAHALTQHAEFNLVGFVDPNLDAGHKAAARWNTKAFTSLAEAMTATQAQGAVVTTPDFTHEAVLMDLLNYPIKFVVAEKPFTGCPETAQRIADAYAEKGVTLVINFTRRFIPEFQALRASIQAGKYGKLLSGQAYYGKGWRHNGSHLINTLQWVFDDVKVLQVFGEPLLDYTEDDPSYNVLIKLDHTAVITAHAVDSRAVTVYELELLFETQRIRVLTNGLILSHPLKQNPVFSGYTNYDAPVTTQANLGQALPGMYTHVKQLLLSTKTIPLSSPQSAITTLQGLSQVSKTVLCK